MEADRTSPADGRAERKDGTLVLPFPIWREAFINDADLESAQRAYDVLNPHPYKPASPR
jgi:hypothetical protein